MSELATGFLVGLVIQWVTLMIVVPIAGSLAGFSFPGWKEAAWKLAVVALVTNVVSIVLSPISSLVATIGAVIVFWVLMVKWFDVNLLGAILIVVISWLIRMVVFGVVMAALASAAA